MYNNIVFIKNEEYDHKFLISKKDLCTFIDENKDLLSDNEWDRIFNVLLGKLGDPTAVPINHLIYTLLCFNIEFFDYLNVIPSYLFINCPFISRICISDNISTVDRHAFQNTASPLLCVIFPSAKLARKYYTDNQPNPNTNSNVFEMSCDSSQVIIKSYSPCYPATNTAITSIAVGNTSIATGNISIGIALSNSSPVFDLDDIVAEEKNTVKMLKQFLIR